MDSIDNKTRILFSLPVAIGIILLGIAYSVHFEDEFSPVEQQIMRFTYRPLSIAKQDIAASVKVLKGPLNPDPSGKAPETPGRPAVAAETVDPEVSLITISGDRKMAMIQGVLVTEGDVVDGYRVVKIEPKRVLLNNKENIWIYIKR